MPYTHMHGVARLLVGVVGAEYISDYVPWNYDGLTYDLDVVVEEAPREDNNTRDTDVDMTGGGDGSVNQEMEGNPSVQSGQKTPT